MRELKLLVESTKSRRGKHLARSIALVVRSNGKIEVPKIVERAKGTYAKGEAGYVSVKLNRGDVVVWLKLIKNFLNKVSGVIVVYNDEGEEVLRLVYRKLKIRRSKGDPRYWNVVERVLKLLKLEDKIRKVNLKTGAN
jgi:hypothetical protein